MIRKVGKREIKFDLIGWARVLEATGGLRPTLAVDNKGYTRVYLTSGHTLTYVGALHRLVLGLPKGQTPEVDHINRDKNDNTRSNLRICTRTQNMANRGPNRFSQSGLKGVSGQDGKWKAKCGGAYIGLFETPEEAARAHDRAAQEKYGEFAFLNFPETNAA